MAEKFGEKKDKSAAEMRKINKPLMERKRRERINNCLNQLKMFLMETTKKDSSYYSKLEKADILELTVKYLKSVQRQQLSVAMVTDPKVASKYTAGYSQCANEVSRYLGKLEGFSPEMQNRLLAHLSGCVQKVATSAATVQVQSPVLAPLPGQSAMFTMATQSASTSSTPSHTQSRPDSPPEVPVVTSPANPTTMVLPGGQTMYFNSVQQPQQQQQQQSQPQQQQSQQPQNVPVLPVQLIPAKLPSGDMVFLMANTQATVPMATNFVASPMSIQIPNASSTTSSSTTTTISNTSTSSNCVFSVGGTGSLTTSLSQLPTAVATGGTGLSNLGLPGVFSSAAVSSTSIAIVPPQVQECKQSPSSMPTDLSMKSSLITNMSNPENFKKHKPLEDAKPEAERAPMISPFYVSSAPILTVPETKRETLSHQNVEMSLLSAAAESRHPSEDENNNIMDIRTSSNDIRGRDNTLSSDREAQNHASSKPETLPQQPNVQGDQGDQAGPSGLGPMWRPW